MRCDWCGMLECPFASGSEPAEIASVVAIEDMDNETFLKHMDLRHASSVRNGPLSNHPDRDDGWVQPYRAFHDRLHEVHADHLDHEHLW